MVVEFCGFLLCVCVLLSGLIGYGGLRCGFAVYVFFAWWVYSVCVCVFFFLGGFAGGGDGGGFFFFFFVSCGMGGGFCGGCGMGGGFCGDRW